MTTRSTLRSIYWLVGEFDDADSLRRKLTGATAATGPDGDVVTLGEIGIFSDGDWRLDPEPYYWIRISMGVFHK